MKRKNKVTEMWKRGMSIALTCAMTVSLLPAFSLPVSAAETELLKAGTLPATESTVTYDQPLASGTAGSTQFRIPAFISVDNGAYRGNLVAAADARWTVTVDGGGLDTIASVSEDMGRTWHYSFPIYFPDSNGYDGNKATTAIDPALVEGADGTIYCLADMNPTGITTYFGQVNQGTGYVEIDGVDRLVLTSNYSNAGTLPTESDKTTYEYYVGDFDDNGFAPVLKRSDNTASEYGVDEWYNLYHVVDGKYVADLTQTQTNSATTIQQNAFYKGSALHVYNTGYIWMVKSTDGGWTWEDPTILNPQIKRPTGEYALLVSPGKGLTLKNGTITIPFYDHGDGVENVSFIYSKDNGQTWKRTNDVGGSWTSESEMVELEDGTLRMFSRTGTGKIAYADATMNEDGDYEMGNLVQTSVAVTSTCNVTASVYSQKIDGKEAILVACPTGGSRANGKIFTFLVDADDNNSMELYSTYSMPDEGYGTNYAYSCMDEQTDGTIGLFYEPNESSVQRCIYTSLDMADITGGKLETKVQVTADTPYVTTYAQVAADNNITKQPDSEIATVQVEHNTMEGTYLYPHGTTVASSMESFSATPDTSLSLSDCEFTLASAGGNNVYTIKSSTNKYLDNTNAASFFQNAAKNMTVEPVSVNGETKFKISNGATRYVVFYPTTMSFDAYNGAGGTNVDYNFVLLEKSNTRSEGDLVPGYTRVSSVTAGKSYLIAYIWSDNSVIVLHPTNDSTGRAKQVKTGSNSTTTLTITKGTKSGMTTAVVDGKTYKILADAQEVRLGKGNSFTVEAESEKGYTAESGLQVTSEVITGSSLYDHNGSGNGFSSTANPALTLEKAEVVLESSGSAFKVKSSATNMYLVNSSANAMWSTEAANLSFNQVSGEDGAYNICSGDTYAANNRHLCFYFTENNFNANSTKGDFSGSYSLLVLEKKAQAADGDVIPGYQKVNTLTSGKSYLIAYAGTDGAVYVLYPVTNTAVAAAKNPMTKKYVKPSGSRLTVTGTEIGNHNLTVDGTLYAVNVVCLHKNVTVEGRQEATCETAGATGVMTCTDCHEKLTESVPVAKKGHWYFDGEVTKEPTAAEAGVLTYYCGLDRTHTITEEIPALGFDMAALTEKLEEAEAELAKTDAYTPESLKVLQDAYDAAAAVTDATPESEAAEKLQKLTEALAGLETLAQEAEKELQASVTTAAPVYEAGADEYTPDSWAAFENAYQAAMNPPADATKEELAKLKAELDTAFASLVKKGSGLEDAKAKSQAALAAAKAVYDAGQGSYTADSWAAFKSAYEALSAAANSTDAAELTRLTAALTDAQGKLAKGSDGGSTPIQNPGTQPTQPTAPIEAGKIYDSGNYYYRVISTSEKTAEVTGLKKKSLTKIVIYNSVNLGGETYKVTSVAANAFKGNKKITSVTVKKGITAIGNNAFSGCTKLKKVVIKSTTLKSIGAKAFNGCKKLTNITIKSKALKKVGKNAFKGINKKAVIKVPAAKLKAYRKLLAKKGQSSTVRIK